MAIEDFPVTALGTYDEPTWAEVPTVASTPVAPSAGVAASGLGNVTLAAGIFNYLFRQPYRWLRALAHRTPRSDLGLVSSYVQEGGTYATGGGTLSVALPLTEVWVQGVLVQVADALSSPHVFTASRDSYLILNTAGVRTDVETALGAGVPVLSPGEVIVSKTVTDGTGVVTSTLSLTDVPTLGAIGIDALDVIGNLDVTGNATVTGTLDVTGQTSLGLLDVANDAVFQLNVEIGGDLDMVGNNVVNGGLLSSVTLATSGNASIGGNLDMTSGSISNVTTLGTSGLATVNQLAVTTTSAFTGIINPLAGINLGGQQISGTASSIVDVERGLFDKIEMTDMASTFSTTGGHARWNTTALMVAQSAAIGKTNAVEIPQRGYDIAFSTSSAIDDTTAEVTRSIQQAEPVWITVYFRWEISSATTNMAFRIAVDGTPGSTEIGTTTFRATVANVGYPFAYTIRWTPTDSFITPGTVSWTFRVRLGTSAGTLTCANVMIKVASALEV